MAEAVRRSITRRSVVAGSAALPAAAFAAGPAPDFADARSGLRADPIYAAIDAHARAYAAYDAQVKTDAEDFDAMMLMVDAEHEAAAAFAATVPTTLLGLAAAFAHVRTLRERDDYPMLDDWHAYAFTASAEIALRRTVSEYSLDI